MKLESPLKEKYGKERGRRENDDCAANNQTSHGC